jgi:predicted aldo/keto reductase-like oxidoreductase
MMGTALRKNQSGACNCIGCGKCEQHCPQGIAIRQELKKASKELEGPLYRLIAKVVKTFRFFG